MAKTKTAFVCTDCGADFKKWAGLCSVCGSWNTLSEIKLGDSSTSNNRYSPGINQASITLAQVNTSFRESRIDTGIDEFNRVLGSGLVIGSVVLLGGDPGIGKSTLLLQIIANLAEKHPALYVSGEESVQQISSRAHRLNLKTEQIQVLTETSVEKIISTAINEKPKVMVIDSIQTIFTDAVASAPGSVSQVRESAAQLVQYAKHNSVAIFLVGHVTKEGAIAGPRVLEHMVDTVLYFEGDSNSRFRVIRAMKNRFGAVNELGVFAMLETGLKQVKNPSKIFMANRETLTPGSITLATKEGSRPLLVELQALVDDSYLPNPRRVCLGFEQNRIAMLLAVLHKHGGIATFSQDVFVNIAGGVKITETAADLAVILAVFSSLRNQTLAKDLVVFGEVGLAGEVRPVQAGEERLREAVKHGFTKAIIPRANKPIKTIKGLDIVAVDVLHDVLTAL